MERTERSKSEGQDTGDSGRTEAAGLEEREGTEGHCSIAFTGGTLYICKVFAEEHKK